ncbi:unnamed protein product [Cuscuta europaea]|uniref:Uncharacterized protein n=1 Tax=Cuscuta europaea TaxID=41803 RepID=A0A9P0ZB50_CUSEU|nr:unnamed protein product [Cuscuta europaea]
MIFKSKPKLPRIEPKNSQSTLAKALAISNFTIRFEAHTFLSKLCNISKAIKTWLERSLPPINLDCSFDIILGKRTVILEAKIRVLILLKKGERQIGRKSPNPVGFFFLGIRTILTQPTHLGIGKPKKNSCTTITTSLLIISQHPL